MKEIATLINISHTRDNMMELQEALLSLGVKDNTLSDAEKSFWMITDF